MGTTNMAPDKIKTTKEKKKHGKYKRTCTLQDSLRRQCRRSCTTKNYRPIKFISRASTVTTSTIRRGSAVSGANVSLELATQVHVLLVLLLSAKT